MKKLLIIFLAAIVLTGMTSAIAVASHGPARNHQVGISLQSKKPKVVAHVAGLCGGETVLRRKVACNWVKSHYCGTGSASFCVTGGDWPVLNFQRMYSLYGYEYESKYAESTGGVVSYGWACVHVRQQGTEYPYVEWSRGSRCP